MIYAGLFILHSAYMILGTCDPLEHILNKGNKRCLLTVIDSIPHVLHTDPCPRQAQGHSVQRPDFLFIQIYFKDSVQIFIYFPCSSFAFIVLSTFSTICLFVHLCVASSEVRVSGWYDIQLHGDQVWSQSPHLNCVKSGTSEAFVSKVAQLSVCELAF